MALQHTIPARFTSKVTILITPRLHGPYQRSLANRDSQKHLIFPIPGILTMLRVALPRSPPWMWAGGGDSSVDATPPNNTSLYRRSASNSAHYRSAHFPSQRGGLLKRAETSCRILLYSFRPNNSKKRSYDQIRNILCWWRRMWLTEMHIAEW
jgi:hypothetical protein